ncbi:hypothetical protein ACM01_15045 [Streptomyces viridochromogenes]|uniref:Integral membrane protein n=1 Tax=Streptomyces viridochromogenes TaxID=1938 RepID=A0A0J7ZDR7_STRVR|nr:hypothetical protein [Streptomyces viridochromogenes]KMS74231.1 hypothetical protein ACM01_15045 [Streptomyces viridochromogenes]
MVRTRAIERLALFGCLLAAFGEIHPFCDHWAQGSETARCKRLHGKHLVYRDGVKAGEEKDDRSGEPTMTASERGRRAVALHVATYTAIQTGAAAALTRAFGYRLPASALLVQAAINGVTHAAIDRGALLLWLARKARQSGYIEHCQAVRLDKDGTMQKEINGPGTAWIELDAALHRLIGVGAAAVTTLLATRLGGRR